MILEFVPSELQGTLDVSGINVLAVGAEDCSCVAIHGIPKILEGKTNFFYEMVFFKFHYSGPTVPEPKDVPELNENGNNIVSNTYPALEVGTEGHENDSRNKKGKKRKINSTDWKKNTRKAKRAAGEKYTTVKGNMKNKVLRVTCDSKCPKNCSEKIPENNRLTIHSQFWNSSNMENQKRQFIISCIEEVPVQRVRLRNGNREGRRKISLKYFFTINGVKIPVCRKFFLNTLSISQTKIRTALNKRQSGGVIQADLRGKHEPINKISLHFKNLIREHIQKFPCVESHYSRNKSQRKYLGTNLNISRMYNLFHEDCEDKGFSKEDIPKCWLYADIFNSEFNLSFSSPSKDTCDLCDEFTIKLKDTTSLEERSQIQEEYDIHLLEAQKRYSLKHNDKEDSQGKPNEKVIMVDLQKCLPTPLLHNAQSFYSLKLWSLNYTVYDSSLKKSSCFMWDESLAGRGGNEMASCLLRYIIDLDNSIDKLIIWSDNCPSQNRNMHMILCYFYALQLKHSITSIEHRYLLRGHTHMEVDSVHSRLEREMKKTPDFSVMTPWDWQQMARLCSSKSDLEVKPMELEDFKNFGILYEKKNSPFLQNKKTTTKENFLISKVVCMKFKRDSPGILYFKQAFDENFKEVDFFRKPFRQNNANLPDLKPIRSTLRPISKKKYDDLQNLLKWVPKRFHGFYKELAYDDVAKENEQ